MYIQLYKHSVKKKALLKFHSIAIYRPGNMPSRQQHSGRIIYLEATIMEMRIWRTQLKHSNYKLKLHIAKLVMETEMQNKHLEKKRIKKDIKRIGMQLKQTLGLIYI